MFLIRALGWLIVVLAVTLASADAVMALGPRDYVGLATGDLWTFILGQNPPEASRASHMDAIVGITLLHLPVWLVLGPVGLMLCILARRRHRRRYFRRS
jgi:ABC-type phosphate transport system permease subunit